MFDINLEEVLEGTVPSNVLAEYAGHYELQFKGTEYQYILKHFLGGPYEKAIMTIENEGSLLYFTFTASPKAELYWKEKDHFDSSAFYDTKLIFKRDAAGNIHEVLFKFLDGKEMKGFKV